MIIITVNKALSKI